MSASGGEWFSKTLRSLPEGARVFACIPKTGYVGVGRVIGPARRFDEATVPVDGSEQRLEELPLKGTYSHADGLTGEDTSEYVVPVSWSQTRPREQAVWKKGMFANQNSACKLRNKFTLDELAAAFDLDSEPAV